MITVVEKYTDYLKENSSEKLNNLERKNEINYKKTNNNVSKREQSSIYMNQSLIERDNANPKHKENGVYYQNKRKKINVDANVDLEVDVDIDKNQLLTEYDNNKLKTQISQNNTANFKNEKDNNLLKNEVSNIASKYSDTRNYYSPYSHAHKYNYDYSIHNKYVNNDGNLGIRFININKENELFKENNLNLKLLLEREKANNYNLEDEIANGIVVNISELEHLKEYLIIIIIFSKIHFVEKENVELKSFKTLFINSCHEKLSLFLKLCRKYIKKLKNLFILFSKIETSNLQSIGENREMMLLELTHTIDKFNSTIHSPHLVKTLLELEKIENLNDRPKLFEKEIDEENLFKNEFNFLDVIKKLESKIITLVDENNQLSNKNNEMIALSKKSSSEAIEKNEEINKLKKNLNEQKLREDEMESSLQYVKQINKDLENKINILEDEINIRKKNIKYANERLNDFELCKNKNVNLENELKYKESIVSYLESLLKSNNINFAESKKRYNINTNKKNNYFSNIEELEFNYKDKDEAKKKFFGKNSTTMIKNNKIEKYMPEGNNMVIDDLHKDDSIGDINSNSKYLFDQSLTEYRIKPSSINNSSPVKLNKDHKHNTEVEILSTSKTSNLKSEIDDLDGEIKQLQNKLRIMIEINKRK